MVVPRLVTTGGGGGLTVIVAAPLLLLVLGSNSFPFTLAVALIGPEFARTRIDALRVAFGARLPIVQSTVVVTVQLPGALAEIKVTLFGSGITACTPVAGD